MARRLVILGSSLTALAVARDAHAHGLMPIVVDTRAGIAFRSRWARGLLVPPGNPDEVVTALAQHAGDSSVLVATGDDWLRFIVAKRPILDRAFGQVLHPENAILQICLSKSAFSGWCAANGLPSPLTWNPSAAARPAALELPVLIRPCETLHDRPYLGLPKAVEACTEDELRDWIDRFQDAGVAPLVSESLLAHRLTQYSVPFARRSNALQSFVAEKVRPPAARCAQGTLVKSRANAVVEQLGRRAAVQARYYGIGEVEILHSHDRGRSYLIELNARPWLQYALAPATGHDFLGLMLGMEDARPPPARRLRTWINLRDDRYVTLCSTNGRARRLRSGVTTCLRALARSDVYAVFDPRDPMPFMHTLLRR